MEKELNRDGVMTYLHKIFNTILVIFCNELNADYDGAWNFILRLMVIVVKNGH